MNGLRKLVSAIHPRALVKNVARLDSLADSTRELRRAVREIQETLSQLASQTTALNIRTEQLLTLHREDTRNRARMARLERLLDVEHISAHVRDAVNRSELFEDPFPHVVVTDLLPPKIYDVVVDAIPPRVFFQERPVNRQQLSVPLEFAPQYSIAVWQFLTETIVRRAIGPALVDRFRQPLAQYLTTLCPSVESVCDAGITFTVSDGRILLRRPGYVIPPHRDPQWGFLTTIIYLARPGDREDYGTQLYSLDVERESPSNAPFYVDPEMCRLVKTVPFRANTALTFLNSTGAHGASIPPDAPADTERYIYQFRVGPEKGASEAFLEKMPEAARRKWDGVERSC